MHKVTVFVELTRLNGFLDKAGWIFHHTWTSMVGILEDRHKRLFTVCAENLP